MEDGYVGDIGDYGKYGLLRAVTSSGLSLAVNWYWVRPVEPSGKKSGPRPRPNDGKYISYLDRPEAYRHYDPPLFDRLGEIVRGKRSVQEVENSGICEAVFFREPLIGEKRAEWHQQALHKTQGAEVVFLDPDNGLETANMRRRGLLKEKHAAWQEVKDYYDREQSVILYQQRPRMVKKAACVAGILDFQTAFLKAHRTLILEYPRYTNRYYVFFVHEAHRAALEAVWAGLARDWGGLCRPVPLP